MPDHSPARMPLADVNEATQTRLPFSFPLQTPRLEQGPLACLPWSNVSLLRQTSQEVDLLRELVWHNGELTVHDHLTITTVAFLMLIHETNESMEQIKTYGSCEHLKEEARNSQTLCLRVLSGCRFCYNYDANKPLTKFVASSQILCRSTLRAFANYACRFDAKRVAIDCMKRASCVAVTIMNMVFDPSMINRLTEQVQLARLGLEKLPLCSEPNQSRIPEAASERNRQTRVSFAGLVRGDSRCPPKKPSPSKRTAEDRNAAFLLLRMKRSSAFAYKAAAIAKSAKRVQRCPTTSGYASDSCTECAGDSDGEEMDDVPITLLCREA